MSSDPPLDLTIAIPSYDDNGQLTRLLRHLEALNIARQVIVVDDGSLPAPALEALAWDSGLAPDRLILLRQSRVLGAGAARNRALLYVKTRHLMFLDADDLPTRELRSLCHTLAQADPFDFCIFQHHDSRMARDSLWGQMPFDQDFWVQAGLAQGGLRPVADAAAPLLAQTANYPWNKIYRTDFLLDQNIRCSETLVHNDIALHWQSFLRARRILSSARTGVTHFVQPGGGRLTNRLDGERLRVFEPLEQIALEIAARHPAGAPYSAAFFGFALGLLNWVQDTLAPEFQAGLKSRGNAFLRRHLSRGLIRQLKQQRPADWQRAAELFSLPG
ncbi:glycosyltransferase family A protein [Leisingera sp. ANG59]|uniref:glycosyltransferase family A protein n=1 Tax=Leisingera sp. ANG59 TaxID=2675221 RepID=UPI0015731E11|nr:glycosyltransferase family A protein [Leisingera sp. ANG59]NSY39538.1 glycosyltransferase [Leisingera sp. ANG59]